MKNVTRVKLILGCVGFFSLSTEASGIEVSSKPPAPAGGVDAEPIKNPDALRSDVSPGVVETLRRLHADNLREIEMGKMAEQKGTLPETRAFGRTVVLDHTTIDAKVMALLKLRSPAEAGLSVNATSDGHSMDNFKDQHGVAWDLAFAKMMSAGHAQVVQLIRAGRNGISDKQFTSMLSSFLPTLKKHQSAALKIQAKSAKLMSVSDVR